MVNVFANFSVPQIARIARRSSLTALGLGAAALVVLAVVGYPLAGLGVCVGMVLALANFRLISSATARASARGEATRRPLAVNTLARMGVITAVALGLVLVDRQLGFGTLVGLALFQFAMIVNVVVLLLRDQSFVGSAPVDVPAHPGFRLLGFDEEDD